MTEEIMLMVLLKAEMKIPDLKNPSETDEGGDDTVDRTIIVGHVSAFRMDLTTLKVFEAGLV